MCYTYIVCVNVRAINVCIIRSKLGCFMCQVKLVLHGNPKPRTHFQPDAGRLFHWRNYVSEMVKWRKEKDRTGKYVHAWLNAFYSWHSQYPLNSNILHSHFHCVRLINLCIYHVCTLTDTVFLYKSFKRLNSRSYFILYGSADTTYFAPILYISVPIEDQILEISWNYVTRVKDEIIK